MIDPNTPYVVHLKPNEALIRSYLADEVDRATVNYLGRDLPRWFWDLKRSLITKGMSLPRLNKGFGLWVIRTYEWGGGFTAMIRSCPCMNGRSCLRWHQSDVARAVNGLSPKAVHAGMRKVNFGLRLDDDRVWDEFRAAVDNRREAGDFR